jgi:integrase
MPDRHAWLHTPLDAYQRWQETAAVGAHRRPFAARSVIQHRAMFEHFHRHLGAQRVSLATFGAVHLDAFFDSLAPRCAPGTTTRLRYLKLLDRLCRHLVETDVRDANPVAPYLLAACWPDSEPDPLFLSSDDDRRLQQHVGELDALAPRALRNRAITALLLATGITAHELRVARRAHLVPAGSAPYIEIPAHGARPARQVALAAFALPALRQWLASTAADATARLFPAPRGGAMNDATLGLIVRDALGALDIRLPDMSPRVLRNTCARRALQAGEPGDAVGAALGLTSPRTIQRLIATLGPAAIDAAAARAPQSARPAAAAGPPTPDAAGPGVATPGVATPGVATPDVSPSHPPPSARNS